jgi:hypothetical protein
MESLSASSSISASASTSASTSLCLSANLRLVCRSTRDSSLSNRRLLRSEIRAIFLQGESSSFLFENHLHIRKFMKICGSQRSQDQVICEIVHRLLPFACSPIHVRFRCIVQSLRWSRRGFFSSFFCVVLLRRSLP